MLPGRLSGACESCSVPIAPGGRTLGATPPAVSSARGHYCLVARDSTAQGAGTQDRLSDPWDYALGLP
jgi:hypothetical protein